VSVSGFRTAASASEPVQLASLTKLVTALVVLDQAPLEPGEQGPSYDFEFADQSEYWSYIQGNQSALNVPDGGSLTQYEMLQGILIASASNYADRLATEVFGSVEQYTDAANAWLAEHDLSAITVTDASGFDRDNLATPASILALTKQAMANPVIAEIVATPSAELPGAGEFDNTNALLGTDGVIGVKTGSYGEYYNLIAARTATVGDRDVTLYASVTGQPTDELRVEEAADLLDQVAADAATPSTLEAGTIVANVTTVWGASGSIVTADDASLPLWNAAAAQTDVATDVTDERDAGDGAGTLTLTGPTGSVEVDLVFESAVPGPDMWWRLTHPLELLGLG
jgi:serine-type D-Ala-D-Ala carboxypeptidase (penicillin-binding protein 5/6)